MKINLFISIISVSTLLGGCGVPFLPKTHFTQEDLQWFECYFEGDSMVFACCGAMDTLVIDKIYIVEPKNHNPFDTEGINWLESASRFNAYGEIGFHTTAGSFNNIEGRLFIEKEKNQSSPRFRLSMEPCIVSKTQSVRTPEDEILMGDATIGERVPKITSYLWSKREGLKKYSLRGDSTFVKIKSLPTARELKFGTSGCALEPSNDSELQIKERI